MKNIHEEKNNKFYLNGKETTVPTPVRTIIDLQDRVIVMCDYMVTEQNIFCLDVDGNILWKIQECPHGDGAKPYTNIKISETGELIAYNYIGYYYRVDLNTGTVDTPPGDELKRAW